MYVCVGRVGYILNVTKEIDNFYPGTFDYLNIRVYDDEKTELLKHWDKTYKYITQVRYIFSLIHRWFHMANSP